MRFALVIALFGAGWSIYRRLPEGESVPFGSAGQQHATTLQITLRRPPNDQTAVTEAAVQLYSIDIESAQREYASERRAGMRFGEFLMRRMGKRQPIVGRFDERGQIVMSVPPGKWWVHATLSGEQEITWRLPINVSGRERIVELTPENAYTRAKSF